jgi:hypothetical protein
MAEQSKVQEYLELDTTIGFTRLTDYVTPSGGSATMRVHQVIIMARTLRFFYC